MTSQQPIGNRDDSKLAAAIQMSKAPSFRGREPSSLLTASTAVGVTCQAGEGGGSEGVYLKVKSTAGYVNKNATKNRWKPKLFDQNKHLEGYKS
jgi:hypothetical protein